MPKYNGLLSIGVTNARIFMPPVYNAAPPTPEMALPTIRTFELGARAQMMEPTWKSTTAMT